MNGPLLSSMPLNTTFPCFHLTNSVGWVVLSLTNFMAVAVKLPCVYTDRDVGEQ